MKKKKVYESCFLQEFPATDVLPLDGKYTDIGAFNPVAVMSPGATECAAAIGRWSHGNKSHWVNIQSLSSTKGTDEDLDLVPGIWS